MTHLEEVKAWLAEIEHWRERLGVAAVPKPRVPPSVATWLMDQAMELDDASREESPPHVLSCLHCGRSRRAMAMKRVPTGYVCVDSGDCADPEPGEGPDLEYTCPPQWVRDKPEPPCPHGRAAWRACPHCTGRYGVILEAE